ncbi:hypothetical protein GGTG_07536 [Gaeumannomyces tritici R3-111a-1]|uniref:Secreted protein n=1 Tax=Gaeumannomyces tritici (strain R3-111a-1) TaxID=644352 RepID=J3P1Y8_GAET3|nr:hypothetical protein GGTG_07536 [Gaeumannomyces tritici R3-111a-1]EJT73680.1 hypothetical protein GGTG_07536 [Gaeumannomyces tritici R3-111a-1]
MKIARLRLAVALSLSRLSLLVSAQETLADGLTVFPNCSVCAKRKTESACAGHADDWYAWGDSFNMPFPSSEPLPAL